MSSSKRKQASLVSTVETQEGGSNESARAAMNSTCVALVEGASSESKEARARKKPRKISIEKSEETQQDPNKFGTMACERPQRIRRAPVRYDNNLLPPTKSKQREKTSSVPKSKLGQKSKPQKLPSQTTLRRSARNKHPFHDNDKVGIIVGHLPNETKQSIVVSLNVGSDHLVQLAASLQQDVPLPSTTADEVASPNHQEANPVVRDQHNFTGWTPQTPGSNPETVVDASCSIVRTPERASSQEYDQPVFPLTPASGSRSADSKLHLPELPMGESSGPPSSVADSDATTEVEDAVDPPVEVSELDRLRALAHKLARCEVGTPKPEPASAPEVWADGRQELCETLHYYRAYQSACYSTGGFVRGLMFDKVAHRRDFIDSNVVISRAGGGQMKDKDTGELRTGRDQVEDSVAQNLRNCKNHYNPVVIVVGVDNPHFPSQPPHQYCVMDYFKPTHIWFEKDGKSKIVRYRFEKLNVKKQSWWRPKDSDELVELGSLAPPNKQACLDCRKTSTQVYLNGWMCLEPACTRFWKIPSHNESYYEPEETSLMYDPRFLKQKTAWPNEDHNYSLTSNDVELSGHSIPGEDTSEAFWLGSVCPDCGRCNSRLSWLGWECGNPNCSFRKEPPHTLIPALSLREPLWPVTGNYTLSRDIQSPLIGVRVSFTHGYRINRYNIPGIDGFITHMIANKTVLEESGGPDSMFEELQQTDIGLRRRPMPNGQLKGPIYCRHFTVNYGMPYKFIAATASHSFKSAARPITATRSRLNWAAKLLLSQEHGKSMQDVGEQWKREGEFNEVLALGYFEAQKMNYHDDGEFGLGPTIATLSLGAPGNMRIRMKARHYHGVSTAGVYDDAPPLPGCQQYEARAALQPALDALKLSDSKAYNLQRKQIPKDLGLKGKGNAKEVLNMQLGHGDIVVMHGRELQRYYEHAVEHAGKLRFALTCRHIDPESLKGSDKPAYEVGPDMDGYDGTGLL
ncbi:hypothetical protein J1614_011211 [Plenodomus biglobosus]|nr:hypothetical protein J1614_011211 [Plenodomus biglobosus]